MAYTLKERFANKNKLKKMSLREIFLKYGNNDLLKEELERRKIENKEEVIEYFQKYMPFNALIDSDADFINYCSEFLQIDPIEVLTWNRILIISDKDANLFLTNNYDWLQNEAIVSKVSNDFLLKSLLQNSNTLHYRHSR